MSELHRDINPFHKYLPWDFQKYQSGQLVYGRRFDVAGPGAMLSRYLVDILYKGSTNDKPVNAHVVNIFTINHPGYI